MLADSETIVPPVSMTCEAVTCHSHWRLYRGSTAPLGETLDTLPCVYASFSRQVNDPLWYLCSSKNTQQMSFGIVAPGHPVITTFTATSETVLQASIEAVNASPYLTVFTIALPDLPPDHVVSVHFQQAALQLTCIGVLSPKCHSVTTSLSKIISNSEIECCGTVYLVIMKTADAELAFSGTKLTLSSIDRSSDILRQLSTKLSNDLYTFLSSFEDIAHQGRHYVDTKTVEAWMAKFNDRVRTNKKFWSGIE